jgi:hypothetical protein
MPSMLLQGSWATHPNAWFMAVASQARMVVNPLKAHDHQEKTMHNSATLSTSNAMGTTMKLLSRNQQLKRPK